LTKRTIFSRILLLENIGNIRALSINASTIQDEIIIIFQVIDYQDDYF